MSPHQQSPLELFAKQFSTGAHARVNQRRKYTDDPYINHPAAVVELVRSVPHTEVMLAAAWLHDTVEDTDVTLDQVRDLFGEEVAQLVEMLTDVSKPEDGNREARKTLDRAHTSHTSPEAKTIKLADLIDNTRSIVERDPNFAVTYMMEKVLLLQVLRDGDPTLLDMARQLAFAYYYRRAGVESVALQAQRLS